MVSSREVMRRIFKPVAFVALSGMLAVPLCAQQAGAAGLQPSSDGSTRNERPPILQQVGIDQHLNEQLPLNLHFRDEAGKDVTLGDYFHQRPVILALGPSEYLMMALWGLTVIATFSQGSLMKGLIASLLGVLTAFIGMDVVTATPRFTFGSEFLMDGISFPVAM